MESKTNHSETWEAERENCVGHFYANFPRWIACCSPSYMKDRRGLFLSRVDRPMPRFFTKSTLEALFNLRYRKSFKAVKNASEGTFRPAQAIPDTSSPPSFRKTKDFTVVWGHQMDRFGLFYGRIGRANLSLEGCPDQSSSRHTSVLPCEPYLAERRTNTSQPQAAPTDPPTPAPTSPSDGVEQSARQMGRYLRAFAPRQVPPPPLSLRQSVVLANQKPLQEVVQ